MFSRLLERSRKGRRLIAPTLGMLLAGTGMALAQPGSDFQNRGIRESLGTDPIRRANTYVMQRSNIISPRYRAVARYMRDRAKRRP